MRRLFSWNGHEEWRLYAQARGWGVRVRGLCVRVYVRGVRVGEALAE